MLSFPDLALGLSSFAIVEPDSTVSPDTNQCGPVWAEANTVDIISVLVFNSSVEFERSAVVEDKVLVVPCSRGSKRPLLPNRDGVDLLRMAINFSNGVSTVPSDAVSVSLLPITNCDYALGIAIPGKIIDSAIDNTVFALGDSFANTIPNPN